MKSNIHVVIHVEGIAVATKKQERTFSVHPQSLRIKDLVNKSNTDQIDGANTLVMIDATFDKTDQATAHGQNDHHDARRVMQEGQLAGRTSGEISEHGMLRKARSQHLRIASFNNCWTSEDARQRGSQGGLQQQIT